MVFRNVFSIGQSFFFCLDDNFSNGFMWSNWEYRFGFELAFYIIYNNFVRSSMVFVMFPVIPSSNFLSTIITVFSRSISVWYELSANLTIYWFFPISSFSFVHGQISLSKYKWWDMGDSNPQSSGYEPPALTIKLMSQIKPLQVPSKWQYIN